MLNLRNQRGSVTFLILSSCIFFIASITGVFMYMQSKQVAVDREYRQIKQIYEKSLNEEDTTEQETNLNNTNEQNKEAQGQEQLQEEL